MKHTLVFLSTALVVVQALGQGLDWNLNPIAWTRDGTSIRSCGVPEFAFAGGRCSRFVARVTPKEASCGAAFATLGIGIGTDEGNYWALQLAARPEARGGGRFFELGEKRDGRWPAHVFDKLGGSRTKGGSWDFGQTYALALELDAEEVRGEVRDATGKVLFSGKILFKGRLAVSSGGPMLVQRGSFRGVIGAFEVKSVSGGARAPAVTFPPYSGESFVSGVVGRRTGFFHVEQLDGRWWVIDPLGRGTVIRGCDGITFEGPHCETLGCNPYGDHNRKTYPSPADWETNTLARLKKWGFNMLGNCRTASMFRRGLAHAIPLNLGDALCKDFDNDEYWIGPDLHLPRTAFPNVFHPNFRGYCHYRARAVCTPNRDDPWLLGYFLDNELAWNGWKSKDYRGSASASAHVHANRDSEGGLFDTCLAKASSHTARQALVRFMDAHYGKGWTKKPVPMAAKRAFLEFAAETYFGAMEEAIRAADPNHMILGARFDGLKLKNPKVLPEVWRAAGRHCDILSFNCYPWADLDCNYVRISPAPASDAVVDVFRHFHEIAKKPFLITEWSFPALDSGLPCRFGAGQRFRTQVERVQASSLYARTILALPFMVGYDYFKWVDQAKLGNSRAFPEDSNYGLVNERDEPYAELTKMFATLHADIGRWRCAQVPARRVASRDPSRFAEGARAALKAKADDGKKVSFMREGDVWAVDNGAGCVWKGRVGGRRAVDSVTLDGHEIGSLSGMVSMSSGSSKMWVKTTKVVSVAWHEAESALDVVTTGEDRGKAFELGLRLTFAPGTPEAVVEMTHFRNIGKKPVSVRLLYFRQHTPFACEMKPSAEPRIRRPCWKEVARVEWTARDGRCWGAYTTSDSVGAFTYSYDHKAKISHPDAGFTALDGETIPPGEVRRLGGDVFMTLVPSLPRGAVE